MTNNSKTTQSRSAKQLQLVLEHRTIGLKMAKRLMRAWGASIEQDELQSLTDLALCESAIKYCPDRGAQFTTFLYLYLRHHLINAIKLRARANCQIASSNEFELQEHSESDLGSIPHEVEVSPEEQMLAFEAKAKCSKALHMLHPLERSVILEIVINGEKVAKYARQLGYSRGHLSEVKTRALTKMKTHLSEYKEAA